MNRKLEAACRRALQQVFGLKEFRPGQKAAASCLLSGRDLLCILPTGAGKSLCWQLPAVVHEGLTLVISPLIALMEDQVGSLRRRGIPAATLNSLMTPEERRAEEQRIRAGEIRILFVAPERLETDSLQRLLADCPPWMVVVDEAHCVVQWGEGFRPAYGSIGEILRRLPERPVLCAMTATAGAAMQRQIVAGLGMAFHRRVILPVLRENLVYSVRSTASTMEEILRLMRLEPCRTVVFCRTRRRTEALAGALRRAGYAAEHYHAGMSREERADVQERFRRGSLLALCATTAFGMGIDIPDVRRVILEALPGSVTDFVQLCGRAGRDGQDAACIQLISPGDLLWRTKTHRAIYMATMLYPWRHIRLLRESWWPVWDVLRLVMKAPCIPAGISAYFGQRAEPCGRCSACLRGAYSPHFPRLVHMDEREMLVWLMERQRDAAAARRGVSGGRLIPRSVLREAAATLQLPDLGDPALQAAMERLLNAVRSYKQLCDDLSEEEIDS